MKNYKEFDCIILGGGLAGVYTALNIDESLSVGVFIKDDIKKGSSNLAQGGIAAEVEYNFEKIEEHYQDTLRAGSYLNNEEATRVLVNEGGKCIKRMRELGVKFDKDQNGELFKTLEGGHRSRRILHAGGDQTGALIMENLREALYQRKNISISQYSF